MRKYKKRLKKQKKSKFLKGSTIKSIFALAILVFSLLSLLSVFEPSGGLSYFSVSIKFIFGWSAFVIAILGVVCGLFLLGLRLKFIKINLILGIFIIVVSMISFTSAFSSESSGIIGSVVWLTLTEILTPLGGIIVVGFGLASGLILATDTPFSEAYALTVGNLSKIFKKSPKPKGISVGHQYQQNSTVEIAAPKEDDVEKFRPETPNKAQTNVPKTRRAWQYPPLSILSSDSGEQADRGDVNKNAHTIEKVLESFSIQAKVVEYNPGPTVTQYAISLPLGTKVSKIVNLGSDLAMALATQTGNVRIEAPIPGKSLIGIEIPNLKRETLNLRQMLTSKNMQSEKSKLAFALGLDISGQPLVADISKMPHILVAGTTGSGKSVLINSIICSILFRANPDEVKFILVDPKRVELAPFNGIPHLLNPVIVEPEKTLSALKWSVREMDNRYELLSQAGVKNIDEYNRQSGFQAMPFIVIVIDELNTVMKLAAIEVEQAIVRLAQMARAVGIHLILATQRPSVDVITGVIKANIPTRIAFNVTSQTDSRVIIDMSGAEKLLGKGDMLYVPPDSSKTARIQGVYVSNDEIHNLVSFLKSSGQEPEYVEEITSMAVGRSAGGVGGGASDRDPLFEEALYAIISQNQASSSFLMRKLGVGYARSAKIIDQLEDAGVVGPRDGSKPRELLITDPSLILGNSSDSAQEKID